MTDVSVLQQDSNFDYSAFDLKTSDDLKARAEKIKHHGIKSVEHILGMAAELTAARRPFEDANGLRDTETWGFWLKTEIGISLTHARDLIRIHKKFGSVRRRAAALVPSFRVLEYLARGQTDDDLVDNVFARVEAGENLTRTEVADIKAAPPERRELPTPRQAREIAKETGRLVEATDGYLYSGASKQEEKAEAARLALTMDVRHAIETLSAVENTPAEWFELTPDWDHHKHDEYHLIFNALTWLMAFRDEWERRYGKRN